ncbi:uncharacterized protein BDV17DRAFT_242649 [Aspergillus undulatus]|uniref:uncharacterized protein n=1 Tax=Aspergillus undulatus TaxID=1810928 RepID=UPI003CCDAB63
MAATMIPSTESSVLLNRSEWPDLWPTDPHLLERHRLMTMGRVNYEVRDPAPVSLHCDSLSRSCLVGAVPVHQFTHNLRRYLSSLRPGGFQGYAVKSRNWTGLSHAEALYHVLRYRSSATLLGGYWARVDVEAQRTRSSGSSTEDANSQWGTESGPKERMRESNRTKSRDWE